MVKGSKQTFWISTTYPPVEAPQVTSGTVEHNPASTSFIPGNIGNYCVPLGAKKRDISGTHAVDENS